MIAESKLDNTLCQVDGYKACKKSVEGGLLILLNQNFPIVENNVLNLIKLKRFDMKCISMRPNGFLCEHTNLYP